ncbi:DUF418 domain-containing protein [Streptomyces thermoalcalitolerans]|uniref:DUF418 domain-containing protein n=1 Tax=Streptomyces thermoalcalitolerans TaxID=65605 RepID=A0ABP3ZNK2_9ACTN
MTQNVSPAVPTRVSPTVRDGREAARSSASTGTPSAGRLVGVDLARGLAVLGMYAAHVGPDATVGGPVGFLMEMARGRSSALFAVLAGFSLVLITGRPHPRTGRAGRQAVARIVIRAVVLMVLGYALTALDAGVHVILSFYGLLFLVSLPLHRLRAGTLALLAAVQALVLPQVLHVLRRSVEEGNWADAVVAKDPLARITGTDGMVELLFTGQYPALTWMPFLLTGMAVARLDLTGAGVRSRLALTGGALALLGYGGSWLALHLVPHALSAVAHATGSASVSSAWWSDTAGEPMEHTPAAWLLVAAPHSQTTFSVLGNAGVALVVLAVCLAVAGTMPRLTRLAEPVSAVGMTALTAYVLHIVALWFIADVLHMTVIEEEGMSALPVLLAFVAAALLLATAWTRRFRRGPLEHVLHAVTRPAQRVP